MGTAGIRYKRGRWTTRSSGQGMARREGGDRGIGSGRRRRTDLLLELGELAALRLEGEDGPVDVRDLGLLHEDVPHLGVPGLRRRRGGVTAAE